jgi:hypothetical protein
MPWNFEMKISEFYTFQGLGPEFWNHQKWGPQPHLAFYTESLLGLCTFLNLGLKFLKFKFLNSCSEFKSLWKF